MSRKIISGGQTGVDRAALDAALDHNFPCGGYCPKGRTAEDGIIDSKYPLTELKSSDYAQRTLENVLAADSTLIIFNANLSGGTALTNHYCKKHKKPNLLVDANKETLSTTIDLIVENLKRYNTKILNVAGPRASNWAEGYSYTYEYVSELILRTTNN